MMYRVHIHGNGIVRKGGESVIKGAHHQIMLLSVYQMCEWFSGGNYSDIRRELVILWELNSECQ